MLYLYLQAVSGFVQNCCNSLLMKFEIQQFYTKPLICNNSVIRGLITEKKMPSKILKNPETQSRLAWPYG